MTGVLALGCVAVVGAVLLAAHATSRPPSDFLRDTVAVLEAPFYIGAVSNLGVLLWCASVVTCLYTAVVLRHAAGKRDEARFFACAAALSAWLLADDAALLHEQVLPIYLGLPGSLAYGLAAAGAIALLVGFRATIRDSDYPLLLGALALFAASMALDVADDSGWLTSLAFDLSRLQLALEDGCKLLGICLWLAYFFITGTERVIAALDQDARPAPHGR